jgi:putative ABC transport system permease protein
MTEPLFLLHSAVRSLRRSRRAAIITLVTLTVGMAVSVSIFAIVNGVLLRPLPFRHPERLVLLWERTADTSDGSVSYPNFLDWQASATSLESLATFKVDRFAIRLRGRAEEVGGCLISSGMLPLLGVHPMLGDGFSPADDRSGGGRVVLLSWKLWNRSFGAQRDVVGKGLLVEGRLFTIAGVMPREFVVPLAPDAEIWMPFGSWIAPRRLDNRGNRAGLLVIGRTKPAADLSAVRRDMARVGQTLAAEYPGFNGGHTIAAEDLRTKVVAGVRPTLLVLLTGALAVLLIACSNAATILLARMTAREHEFTVKLALGATPAAIIAEVLAEVVLLASMAAAAGLIASFITTRLLQRVTPDLPRVESLSLDGTVVLFCVAATTLAVMIAGIGPGIRASRQNLTTVLKESRGGAAGGSLLRTRGLLVALQFALTVALLIPAALLAKSFLRIRQADLGFSRGDIVTMQIMLPGERFTKRELRLGFQDELLRRLSRRGIRSALVYPLPLAGSTWTGAYVAEGKGAGSERDLREAELTTVSPAYFDLLHIPVRRGRTFEEADRWRGNQLIVVDEEFARTEWPGQVAVGKRVKLSRDPGAALPWAEVVGVVPHVRSQGLDTPRRVQLYFPYWDKIPTHLTLITPFRDDPAAVARSVAAEVQALDFDVPLSAPRTLTDYENDVLLSKRLAIAILVLFSAAAVSLAVFGLYGLLSYSLALRRRELGIRLAIGALPHQIFAIVLQQMLRMAAIGVTVGGVIAFCVTPRMGPLLFAVDPHDALAFLAVPALLLACAVITTTPPAYKAGHRDPQALLKEPI